MQGKSWRKVLVGLVLVGFVFGLGIHQAEAGIFQDGRLRVLSKDRRANEKKARKIRAAKMATLNSAIAASGQQNPSLGGTGSVSGIVREYAEDISGNPIDGAPLLNIQVQLYEGDDPNWADEDAWNWLASTTTDANGSYQFTGLTQRRYRLHVYEGQQIGSKHYVEADQYQVQVFDNTLTPNIDFTLREAGRVWGYVKKAADDTPISYARVVAHASYTEDEDNNWHDAWVDANGMYELWLLPSPGKFYPITVQEAVDPGTTYKVYGGNAPVCDEAGLDPLSYGYTLLGSATGNQTFTDGNAYNYYIILAEQGYLVKVDAVQGSSGYLWPNCGWDTDNWGGINGSPPDGNFTSVNQWQGDDSGGYIMVNPGSGNTSLTVYIVDDGRPADPLYYEAKIADGGLYQSTLAGVRGPDFSLNEGGSIYGRIVNEQEVGITNVEAWVSLWTTNGQICANCHRTNTDGYYTVTSIPATNKAYVMAGGDSIQQDGVKYGRNAGYVGPLTVTAGGTTIASDMTLRVAGMISGWVTDENLVPIVGAEIEAWGYDANGYGVGSENVYTDAFGQYTLDYLSPGTYTVTADKVGFTLGVKGDVVVASLSQVDCDLVMRSTSQAATVSGKITNYDAIAAKDADGVLLPYPNESDYESYGYPEIWVSAMQANVDFTDEDYLNLEKFFVGDTDPDDGYENYFEESTIESAGDYSLVLPAGQVNIALGVDAETEDGWYVILHDWQSLALTEGAVFSNQNFTAQTNYGTLKGSISVPSGSLKSHKTLILAFNEADANPGLLDAVAGPEFGTSYNFAQLPAGTYTIRAITDGFVTQVYEHITVPVGGTVTRNIVFTAGGALSGTVTSNPPVEGARVEVLETGSFAITAANGSYAISGLGAGSYTVEVSKSGYATDTQAVSITNGLTTTHNVVLDSQVGSISGTVLEDGTMASVNDATVVAYNTGDGSYQTDTTVGGTYSISELVYGDYIVVVGADGYDTAVYAGPNPDGTLTIDISTPDHTNIDFTLTGIAPQFSVSSSVSGSTLSMTFLADIALDASPIFSVVTGNSSLGTVTQVSPTQWDVVYTVDASDTVVEIKITGASNGMPGSATFSFEVSGDLQETATTNVTNATGGETTMMGTQDDTSVYVPPFALAGTGDTTAVALTIERYGDPGDSVEGTSDQSVTGVYDFSFEDGNVTIASNHTITVTMSFELPAGMTQTEFEDTFEVRYFNVNSQQWVTDGISNVRINWNNYTIMFEVDHLSEFAAFVPQASSTSTTGAGGGGGCFIATAAYGTPLAKEVRILSRFRDTYLLPNSLGQKLVSVYYKLSPPIARSIKGNTYLKAAVRGMLRPVVWLVESFFPEDGRGKEPATQNKNQIGRR